MGTWSYKVFDNDDAMDLRNKFDASKDVSMLEKAFDAVLILKDSENVDASLSQQVIAAAHILQELNSGQIQRELRARLLQKSNRALKKIIEASELKDLWAESPEYADWIKSVESLTHYEENSK